MRKYLKPALEIEAFDVEDVITASSDPVVNPGTIEQGGGMGGNGAAAPIEGIELN